MRTAGRRAGAPEGGEQAKTMFEEGGAVARDAIAGLGHSAVCTDPDADAFRAICSFIHNPGWFLTGEKCFPA